jgi:WD40 repeat protein
LQVGETVAGIAPDFGLAKLLKGDSEMTLTGTVMGSPSYMPPEQAQGRVREITVRSDVYALGAVLYDLVCGRPPFRADTTVETLRQVVELEPVRPRVLNPRAPRDLETIILKCLEKDSARRYGDAQELADELARYLQDEPIRARAVSQPERVWRWCKRKPVVATLGSMVIVLVLGVAIGSPIVAYRIDRERDRAEQERQTARNNEMIARQNAYAADMRLAQQALESDNLGRAVDLLRKNIPSADESDLRGFEWRYLWRLCQSDELASLKGHQHSLHVSFSPDGRTLATCGRDNTAKLWDLASRQLVATLTNHHDGDMFAVSFSPNGRLLAMASSSAVSLRDVNTREEIRSLPAASKVATFSREGRFLATLRGEKGLALWETTSWTLVGSVADSELPIRRGVTWWRPQSVAFSPDGTRLALVLEDGVKLWSFPDLVEISLLREPMPMLKFVTFAPDGRILAASTAAGDLKIWDIARREEVRLFSAHSSAVYHAAFSPDGRTLATASADQTIKLWNLATGTVVRTLRGHRDEVNYLAFSPDGQLLASTAKDGSVKLWHPEARSKPESTLRDLTAWGFSAEGRTLVAATTNASLNLIDLATLEEVGSRPLPEPPVASGFVLADGQTTIWARNPNALEVRELENWRREASLPLNGRLSRVAFAAESKLVAAEMSNSAVQVRELATGRVVATFNATRSPRACSRDGKFLVAQTILEDKPELHTNPLTLFDVFSQKELATLDSPDGLLRADFSPDSRILAGAYYGSFIRLWEVPSGRVLATLSGHKRGVTALAFAPDSQTLASASDDGTVKLWHLATGREVLHFPFPTQTAASLRLMFSTDGKTLVASKQDENGRLVRIWRAPSFEEIQSADVAQGRPAAR